MRPGAVTMSRAIGAFELALPPINAIFGAGERHRLRAALDSLGARRPLLAATRAGGERYAEVFAPLGELSPVEFFEAEPHCPVEVVERCRDRYRAGGCDSVVAVGGGSTLGLGKILAAEESATFVAVPTTYSGSEMTPLYGRKIGAEKRVRRDSACRPRLVVYDSELTYSLPARVAATSGMNSLAHAVEALYPQKPDPLTPPLARQALEALRDGLGAIAVGDRSGEALDSALYGGMLGGILVAACGIALHHQLCHVIGGLFDLPHGETNGVVLPHAVAYNLPAIAAARQTIEAVFGGRAAPRALFDFAGRIGAPQSLRELGMPPDGIEPTVSAMLARGGWNPRPLEREGLERLVRNAFEGRPP